MKFILISDFHFTSKKSRSRIDNILLSSKIKFDYILKKTNKINASIIFAGDLFNSPRDINGLFAFLSILYKYSNVKLFTIWGQHDQYGRNNKVPTNIGILKKSNIIKILNNKPHKIDNINLYGCSWNEKIPKIKNNSSVNILSIHASISTIGLWSKHKYIKAKHLLKENYDLILCGDIHRDFIYKKDNQIICNTGPIMRLEANQFNLKHNPKFYIYDTKTKKLETKYIPCKSSIEVLKKEHLKISNDNNLSLIDDIQINIDRKEINVNNIIDELISKSDNKKEIKNIISTMKERNEN